jgi:hypothetical protein
LQRRLQPPRRLPAPATKRARELQKGVKHPTMPTLVFDVAMPIFAFNVLTRYGVATL